MSPARKSANGGERCALIAGASGMVGRRLGEYVHSLEGWRAIGLARRPLCPETFPIIAADLTALSFSNEVKEQLKSVTDIFYAARYDHQVGEKEPVNVNLTMLRNLVESVASLADDLRHIHLLQGTKYYGFDFGQGPFKTPAKESDGRAARETWYYAQEDYIGNLQRRSSWTWSASRPHGVCDSAPHVIRSLARVISVFATVCREASEPLSFPGQPGNYHAIYQCTDSALLARAIVWMASEPRCANQAFNVTNGDFIRWENLWPRFADYFQLNAGPVRTVSLEQVMPLYGDVWDKVVRERNLTLAPIERAALWSYADAIFSSEYDIMSDTTKLRQYGFCEVIDTETMFVRLFDALRSARVIP